MSIDHLGLIGFGAIARDLLEILAQAPGGAPARVTVLVRSARLAETRAALTALPGLESADATDDLAALLDGKPEVVAECAGHGAVGAYAEQVLAAGVDIVVASVGALADAGLQDRLAAAAAANGAQCVVPAGAIGGIDALGAARLSGLDRVTYTGRKPPLAWSGTPAEDVTDLGTLTKECVFFTGTAREAAQSYPKNANVAATLALAGLGMDATQVRLIADPATTENVHEFSVSSTALDFSMRLVGKPSPRNPKTSRSTAYSVARAVLNRRAAIEI